MQKPSVITESGGQRHREPKIATLMPAAGPARPSIGPRRYVKYVDDLWLSPPPPPEPEGVRIRIRGRHTTDTSRRAAATGWLRARGNGAGTCRRGRWVWNCLGDQIGGRAHTGRRGRQTCTGSHTVHPCTLHETGPQFKRRAMDPRAP